MYQVTQEIRKKHTVMPRPRGWQHNAMMVTVCPSVPCLIASPQWKAVASLILAARKPRQGSSVTPFALLSVGLRNFGTSCCRLVVNSNKTITVFHENYVVGHCNLWIRVRTTMGHVNRLIWLFTVQLSVAPLTIKIKIVFNNILHTWICGVKLRVELCQDVALN